MAKSRKTAKSSTYSQIGAGGAIAVSINNTKEFFCDDFNKTLFPLKTNIYLVENGEQEIREHISKCLDSNEISYSFQAQRRVFAAKTAMHVRRTFKLDVVAEFFIYDIVYRNRVKFRRPYNPNKTHYGYRFESGSPISPTSAYKGFKGAISECSKKYKYSISFDIASYFNNIYHHDIVGWFAELGAIDADIEGLGQVLRQINSGRSVDCLPQGIYPAKMIGNDFLRFIDNFHGIQSDRLIRFMDDFYLFSDNEKAINNDFVMIQRLLGDKGLTVNPSKTKRNSSDHVRIESDIDSAKQQLLQRRRRVVLEGYDENDDIVLREEFTKHPLSESESREIYSILDRSDIEEEDAELILTIMRSQANRVEKKIPYFIENFPNLAKALCRFCQSGDIDREFVADTILS